MRERPLVVVGYGMFDGRKCGRIMPRVGFRTENLTDVRDRVFDKLKFDIGSVSMDGFNSTSICVNKYKRTKTRGYILEQLLLCFNPLESKGHQFIRSGKAVLALSSCPK